MGAGLCCWLGLAKMIGLMLFATPLDFARVVVPCVLVIAVLIALIGTGSRRVESPDFIPWRCYMAAKRDMLWLLVWRALRLRLQRVGVVFTALAVGATIVTALSAVWFDINSKMSEELRTFGANFISGLGTVPACRDRHCRRLLTMRRRD